MRTTTSSLLLLLLLGCAPSPSDSTGPIRTALIPVPGTRTLAIGSVVQVGGTGYRLAIDSLQGDSRCPLDVQCVWEGEFTVHATLRASDGLEMPDVKLSIGTRAASTAAGLAFRFTAVTPAPHAGVPIPVAEYRMTLEVEPASP